MNRNLSALVTGSSDRIGKAIALQLAHMGYNLILHYNHSAEKAAKLQNEIQSLGKSASSIQIDFLENNDFDALLTSIKENKQNIAVLINNASDFIPSSFDTAGSSLFQTQMKSNFESAYLLTKAFARTFDQGCIINILDTKITKDSTNHLDYILSKKLLSEFTRLAAIELAPRFRVNAIAPGVILPPKGKDERYIQELSQHIPLQKHGNLQDIQYTIQFLTESTFITGQIIYVDGGEHLSY